MNLLQVFPLTNLGSAEYLNPLPLFILAFGAIASLLVGAHKEKGHQYAFGMSFITLVIAFFQGAYVLFSSDVTILGETLVFSPFTKTMSP